MISEDAREWMMDAKRMEDCFGRRGLTTCIYNCKNFTKGVIAGGSSDGNNDVRTLDFGL